MHMKRGNLINSSSMNGFALCSFIQRTLARSPIMGDFFRSIASIDKEGLERLFGEEEVLKASSSLWSDKALGPDCSLAILLACCRKG